MYCTVDLLFIHNYILQFASADSKPKLLIHPPTLGKLHSLCLWIYFYFVGKFICVIFYIPHISDIIWHLSFFSWLTSLSMMISRSIHVAENGIILFFFMAEYYSVVYMDHIFIHSSVDGHLCCLQVLTIVNSAAVNIGLYVSFWIIVLSGYMPGSKTPGL